MAAKPAVFYGRSYIAEMFGVLAGTVDAWQLRAQDTDRPFPAPDVIVKSRYNDPIDLGRDSLGRQLHIHAVLGWSEESLKAVKVWREGGPLTPASGEPAVFYSTGAIARLFGKDQSVVTTWVRRWAGTTHEFPQHDVVIKGSTERDLHGWSETALKKDIPEWNTGRPAALALRAEGVRAEKAKQAEATPEGRIRRAYLNKRTGPASAAPTWVPLAAIRPSLRGVSRAEQDAVLKAMSKARAALLAPAPEPSRADDRAAILIRGRANHLIAVID